MGLKRWNARRDGNELEIVSALQRIGALVMRLSEPGAPDLLVTYRQRVYLLEVKVPKTGRATEAQIDTMQQGWLVMTVRTIDDALRAIGAVR